LLHAPNLTAQDAINASFNCVFGTGDLLITKNNSGLLNLIYQWSPLGHNTNAAALKFAFGATFGGVAGNLALKLL